MDGKHVFRRSPSLPLSPRNQYLRPRPSSSPATYTSNGPPKFARRSPPRRQSMQATPSSYDNSAYRRSYSNDINDLVALSSASSGSSDGSSTTKHPARLPKKLSSSATIPSGDSDEIPRGSMRKRLAARSSHSGISPKSKKSLSFRRKKKTRRGKSGLAHAWNSRNALKRILVIILILFVLSFSMAFLSARNSRNQQLTKPTSTFLSDFHNSVTSALMNGPSHLVHLTTTLSSLTSFDSFSSSNTIRRSGLRGSASSEPTFRRYVPDAPLCTDSLAPEDVDFTVVTQLSLNRLWMMEHHCSRWKGFISIAVYSNDGSSTKVTVEETLEKMGCHLDRVTVNVLTGYSEEEYPVNALRNAALSSVTTSHIIYVDIDFWESVDLRRTLQYHLERLASDAKAALVIPAFQLNRQCKEWRECPELNVPLMPQTKDDLLTLMIEKRKGSAFDPTNRGGHGSTRYRDWFDQDADQLVPIECVNSNRYEPYLILRYCNELPPFQEAFTGYGKNKMTWVMQLRREGYKLLQLGQSFVIHYPHLDSKARMYWNGGKDGKQLRRPAKRTSLLDFKRGKIDQTFSDFRTWLEANVPDNTVVPKCHNARNDDETLWTGR